MTRVKIQHLIGDTVHIDAVQGARIIITTEPDGRAVVVVYNELDIRTQCLMYRRFERCEMFYDPNKVDLVYGDPATGQDPEIRKTVPLAAS